MTSVATARDHRTTWTQAWVAFLWPIALVMLIRWAVVEPFVVPSGSMIPSLMIHDHILAEKWAYGIHWPFANKWLWQWSSPERGDIAVFRYPKNPEVFYVKRIVGLPGDEISLSHGVLLINGSRFEQEQKLQAPEIIGTESPEDHFVYFQESMSGHPHTVRYLHREDSDMHALKVPPGHYFAMGDNRDQSLDSRYWGFVPADNLVGRVHRVWLSCSETMPSASYLCSPQAIHWSRIWQRVE